MNCCLKKLSLVFLVAGFVPALNAQKIYTLHPRTDLILMGAGLFAGVGGFVAGQNIEPLEPEDIAMLDRNNVFAIDRKSTYWLSDKADRASNFFFYGAPLAPALLLTGRKARRTAGTISVLYLETLTLTGGLTQLTKNLTLRARPYTYNPEFPFERKQKKVARQSFFSGHTSFSAASCFFTAKVWSDLHPGSRWKPVVWSIASGIPAFTGYLRMRAGRHYFTDVAAGYAVGACIGWLIPTLHKRAAMKKNSLKVYGSSQEVGMIWDF